MKYIKIAAMSLLSAALFCSCQEPVVTPGPGTGVVGFTQTEVTMLETDGLTYIPLTITGEPGGYPVTLTITAEGAEDVNEVLWITSTDPYSSTTTLYIGEDANNSVNLQVRPAQRPNDDADYTITLTIADATGSNISETNNTCKIYIKNVKAVQTGQYTVSGGQGSQPATWSMTLSQGANGTYLMSNLFESTETPVMVGEFNPETMELTFDGRLNGKGSMSYFGSVYSNEVLEEGAAMRYWILQGGGNDGQEPVVFKVNDQYQIESTSSVLGAFSMVYVSDGNGSYVPGDGSQDVTIGVMQGNSTVTYDGDAIDDEYPFKKK